MTIFQILGALLIGVILLAIGIKKKKKRLMIVSAIPLLISLSQIVILFLMAAH